MHERLILDHVAESDYIVCTPDRDIYCETMDVTNEDLRSFRLRPAPGRLPPGVAAGQVYALPNWSAAELSAIRADATREAQAEKARRNVGGAALLEAQVRIKVKGLALVDSRLELWCGWLRRVTMDLVLVTRCKVSCHL